MHPALKKAVPGYIQGYSKDQLRDKLQNEVPLQNSISIDGSAFESTQHESIMRIVDDRLYDLFFRLFSKHLPHNEFFSKHVADLSKFLESWLSDAKDHVNTMFVCLPGFNGRKWPEDVAKIFQRNYRGKSDRPERDYMYLRIKGCTFSGDPYTTVRNTMASDCYAMFYRHMNGEQSPWDEAALNHHIEAGDDLVLWGPDSLGETLL